jgi:hypothetical protein
MKPTLKPPGIELSKLKYDKPLSNFAFDFTLRRYSLEDASLAFEQIGASAAPVAAAAMLAKIEAGIVAIGHRMATTRTLAVGRSNFNPCSERLISALKL